MFLGKSAHRTTCSLTSLLYQSWVLSSNKGGRAIFDTHMLHDRLSQLSVYSIFFTRLGIVLLDQKAICCGLFGHMGMDEKCSFQPLFLIMCTCVLECLHVHHVDAVAPWDQKKASDSLALELQAVVNHLTRALGTKLESSGIVVLDLTMGHLSRQRQSSMW